MWAKVIVRANFIDGPELYDSLGLWALSVQLTLIIGGGLAMITLEEIQENARPHTRWPLSTQ